MTIEDHIFYLKIKLQSLGPVRPEAWACITAEMKQKTVKINESFTRFNGQLAYLAAGLFKEYTADDRDRPSIINFITAQGTLISRKYNQRHYLKACSTSTVFYWSIDSLLRMYQEFPELKPIYDALCQEYDAAIAFRQQLLEMAGTAERIHHFRDRFPNIATFVKKKDIANYLHVNYPHFIRVYNES